MLFPLSDENPTYSRPYVNYALIAVNVVVFLLVLASGRDQEIWMRWGMKPAELRDQPLTLITSMFLHGGFLHVLGNMWFLWIVGDNVEDSLGHGWYLAAYLGGGVVADLIHAATAFGQAAHVPTIGASGAVSAVMGYYVVVFPRNRIRIFYWFWWFFIGTFRARAVWVIGAWFALQLFYALVTVGSADVTGVAYWAHVGGFGFGTGVALVLRAVWPGVDPHRRHGVERAVLEEPGFGRARSYRSIPIDLGQSWSRPTAPAAPAGVQLYAPPEEMTAMVAGRVAAHDVLGAERAFDAFAWAYPQRALETGLHLNLVQMLVRAGRHPAAARCLEHFLLTHPTDANVPEAKLALGMLYARHLGQRDRARALLGAAAVQHPHPDRAALARSELAALG